MISLNCDKCGGEVIFKPGSLLGTCLYCKSTVIIPKELVQNEQLYNRATSLRLHKQFDKAIEIYEKLLEQNNMDADAHWGMVLSRYGIEYVEDPVTGERLPTMHRTVEESVFTDPDYQEALRYADPMIKPVIEADARQIEDIRRKVLGIAQNEIPYDIFICYKESEDNDTSSIPERTQASVLAQEIYSRISQKYKVFFSRITLADRIGEEYEPIIYAALRNAKVMLVVGTEAEQFQAVWVRNEWSRFLWMRKQDQEKTIIPVFQNMSAEDLPKELSQFQAQDMSRIGAMQDLCSGIDRLMLSTGSKQGNRSSGVYENDLERLADKAVIYMKLGNMEKAWNAYCEMASEYPGDYRGWWGQIVILTNNLQNGEVYFQDSKIKEYYGYVEKLATNQNIDHIRKAWKNYLKKVSWAETSSLIRKSGSEIEACDERCRYLRSQEAKGKQQINELLGERSSRTAGLIWRVLVRFVGLAIFAFLIFTGADYFGSKFYYPWLKYLAFALFIWRFIHVVNEWRKDASATKEKTRSINNRINQYKSSIRSWLEETGNYQELGKKWERVRHMKPDQLADCIYSVLNPWNEQVPGIDREHLALAASILNAAHMS